MAGPGKPTVAILGASGTVGRLVVAAASATGSVRLRLGVRDESTSPPVSGEDIFVTAVQPRHPISLRTFLDGADLLVNCLGPGYRARGQVAAVAAGLAVPYLDPNGDDTVHTRVDAATRGVRPAALVTGVGAVPGAFGLLARWLAAALSPPVLDLRGYLVTMEPMHAGTAAEFLLGLLAGGPPSAGVASGGETGRSHERQAGLRLPYVDCPLAGHPLVTSETARLAADLQVPGANFCHAFESGGVSLRYLQTLAGLVRAGRTVRDLSAELAATVNGDMAGRPPLQLIAFEARSAGGAGSLVLCSPSSYRVTAAMVVLAAVEILDGRVAPGLHRADVLSPRLVARLTDVDQQIRLEIRDCSLDDWTTGRPPEVLSTRGHRATAAGGGAATSRPEA